MTEMQVNEDFEGKALGCFSGCDHCNDNEGKKAAGRPGPKYRSIWCFGFAFGKSDPIEQENKYGNGYPIEQQIQWGFNVGLFKLLAAIHGENIENYEAFAREKKTFVKGTSGFFKGNLYPCYFKDIQLYFKQEPQRIGLPNRKAYYNWCDKKRLPVIRKWVEKYKPGIFIGIGITQKERFSTAVFGEAVKLCEKKFSIEKHSRKIFYRTEGWKKLVVMPHFAYGHCPDDLIKAAGSFIAEIMDS